MSYKCTGDFVHNRHIVELTIARVDPILLSRKELSKMKRIDIIKLGLLCILIGVVLAIVLSFGGHKAGLLYSENQVSESSFNNAINLQNAFRRIAKNAIPAVVNISAEFQNAYSQSPYDRRNRDLFREFFGEEFFNYFFGDPRQEKRKQELGSGVVVSEDGYILTNVHVVRNASKLFVTFDNEMEYEAKIIGTDSRTDLALIKIKPKGKIPYLELGNSEEIEVGDWAIAIGNPFGLSQTFTVGVISAKGRSDIGINVYENFIQTDASINPGNSGGPLLNINGEIIGINTAIASPNGGSVGIGFAIPINMAKTILPQLKAKGRVTRGWLGVEIFELTKDKAEPLGLEPRSGVLIGEVIKDSPAEKGGIKPGDVIIEFDRQSIKTVHELKNIAAATPVDKTVNIIVLRDKKKKQLSIKIGEMPNDEEITKLSPADEKTQTWLGIDIAGLEYAKRKYPNIKEEDGVVVMNINPGSPAANAGVAVGDIIKKIDYSEIKTIDDFNNFVNSNKNKNSFLLLIKRSGNLIFLGITKE